MKRHRSLWYPQIALGLITMASAQAVGQEGPPTASLEAPAAVVAGITARELGGHMTFLAHDLMRGRDTASPEIQIAAEYLASRLIAAGAEPIGEAGPRGKTFFQSFPLEVVTAKEDGTSLSLIIEENGSKRVLPQTLWQDFSFFPRGVAPGEVEAPIVFVGAGRSEDFEAVDVRDRFVLTIGGGPIGGGRRGGGVQEEARKRALGVLTVRRPAPNQPASALPGTLRQLFSRPSMSLGSAPANLPNISLGETARDLLLPTGPDGAAPDYDRPRPLDGRRARFTFAATTERKSDRNVLGLFRGSDPDKQKEVIIYSAHYDHVGVNEQGEIFNGSDDNASGTSALLEIAEAFGDGPRPARSIAFLWVSGEEKGLYGSAWFADHMTLPAGFKIVANINMDMISRNDPKTIGITPSPKHADHSTIIPAAVEACQAEGLEAKFNADEFYFRTDSYNFAKKGIPVIFFFSGTHADYHRPTDDVDKADFEKAAKVARASYRLGWRLAQEPEAPRKLSAEAVSGDPKRKVDAGGSR